MLSCLFVVTTRFFVQRSVISLDPVIDRVSTGHAYFWLLVQTPKPIVFNATPKQLRGCIGFSSMCTKSTSIVSKGKIQRGFVLYRVYNIVILAPIHVVQVPPLSEKWLGISWVLTTNLHFSVQKFSFRKHLQTVAYYRHQFGKLPVYALSRAGW